MKPVDDLWERMISWSNLHSAAHKAQKGKRKCPETVRFNFNLEANLLSIQQELKDRTYAPGAFRTHWIDRPKRRMISAAPYRDRVVHHALMNVLEPVFERHFHAWSFACRKGKGTHAAVDTLQAHMRHNRFLLKCDIKKFFPSIDHAILKARFRRLITDERVLLLLDLIVDNSNEQESIEYYFDGDDLFTPHERKRGLPIGNLTSQWFANFYLSPVDHFLSNQRGALKFVRYCDDFIVLANTREPLLSVMPRLREVLARLRLKWHESRLKISPVEAGVRFAGFRVWMSHRLLTKENIHGFRRRLRWMKRNYTHGALSLNSLKSKLTSWLGHAKQADSGRLIQRLSRDWTFVRGGA